MLLRNSNWIFLLVKENFTLVKADNVNLSKENLYYSIPTNLINGYLNLREWSN